MKSKIVNKHYQSHYYTQIFPSRPLKLYYLFINPTNLIFTYKSIQITL